MYTIFDIANWFLKKEEMDHKKLQKLCYYAQAWSLAINNKPIADCKFEAWAHGPVCRTLWEELNIFTYNTIPQNTLSEKASEIADEESTELLERVWETYQDFNGYQLEMLTHREDPWIKARGNIPELRKCTNVISDKEMAVFYRSLYSGDGVGE